MSSPAAASTPALGRIGQIAVNVKDLDRAVGFYRDTLGVPFTFQVPGMAFFQCGDLSLMLGLPSDPEYDHPSSIVYFAVDDIRSAHAQLTRRGVAFRDHPHAVHRAAGAELWLTFFRDTEDNTLALMSWVRVTV